MKKNVRIKRFGMKSNRILNDRMKKMLIGMFVLMTAVLLGGCSLAKEDAANDSSKDRMIGAFITDEYLDLFDMDAYLDDHASSLSDGEEIVADRSPKYYERLYATIDKQGSKDPADWDISFGDVKGINFFSICWEDDSKEETTSLVESDGIYDVNTDYHITDEGENVELSGTIYMLPGQIDSNTSYFVNPVYQTEDGRIYVVSESGGSTSGNTSEGQQFAITISDETTVTGNGSIVTGNIKMGKTTVTVRLSVVYEPMKVTLYQMNKDNQVLQKDEYTPGKLPEKLKASKGCEYFLIETEKKDMNGKTVITREVYEPNKEDCLETFYPGKSRKIFRQSTEVTW